MIDSNFEKTSSAARILERCEALAECSESKTGLSRPFLCPAMHTAHELVSAWMSEAGMTPRIDEMGNLIGYYPAHKDAKSESVWLFGSHLDTVPDAGHFDGMLGVLLAIEMVHQLGGEKFPFAIEVVGFSEEEGVRYKTPYLGSSALAGTFNENWLDLRDGEGIFMADALVDFGIDPKNWRLARHKTPIAGYFEAHIEQGPALETVGAPLGIVSAIAGQSRLQLRFAGHAGHAGTLPMSGRRDALAAASEWVLKIEDFGGKIAGLVATVGSLEVVPNTPNVVPGEIFCTLDVRHADDETRERAVEELLEIARVGAARRGVCFETLTHASHAAVAMDDAFRAQLHGVCGENAPEIVSGAGHDAAVMAKICPCAMLFLRTPGGASHCPEEAVTAEDVELALGAMGAFIRQIAAQTSEKRGELVGSKTF